MEKLKIGVVGAGNIARHGHLPAYKQCNNCVVQAICDIDFERAKAAANDFGIPEVYASVEEMLEKSDIQAVDICTWNNAHAPVLITAAKAGKHVMCEKPLAMSLSDALLMQEAVRENDIIFFLAVPSRFGYANMYLREMYENGELGDVYYAKTSYIRRRGTPNLGVFLDEEAQGGGPIIDIATHSLDLTLYLMNNYEPEMVVGKTHKKLEHPEAGNIWGDNGVSTTPLEEAACAFIRMKNGATIMLETSWALNTCEPVQEGSCVL